MNNDARVILWGSLIGAVTWLEDREIGVFQYSPDFLRSGIELSPLSMPLAEFPYEFPALARNTFKGEGHSGLESGNQRIPFRPS
ncbi:MAG: HipA N-terminal domain-containing protein [Desulfohalobiaceae bacterium]|nr:HipA N-terminal domain-containing protein [Desulfohalobiaceae bacterium]